jgi:hypothetical protein
MMHASICRTDGAAVQAEDVAYVLGSLQTRVYDALGNLRKADDRSGRQPAIIEQPIPQCVDQCLP